MSISDYKRSELGQAIAARTVERSAGLLSPAVCNRTLDELSVDIGLMRGRRGASVSYQDANIVRHHTKLRASLLSLQLIKLTLATPDGLKALESKETVKALLDAELGPDEFKRIDRRRDFEAGWAESLHNWRAHITRLAKDPDSSRTFYERLSDPLKVGLDRAIERLSRDCAEFGNAAQDSLSLHSAGLAYNEVLRAYSCRRKAVREVAESGEIENIERCLETFADVDYGANAQEIDALEASTGFDVPTLQLQARDTLEL